MADKVYDAAVTFDKAWIWDVAFDVDENPILVYARFSHRTALHSYWYAKWNGQSWDNHLITDAGQWFQRNDYIKDKPEYEFNYSGGVYLDHGNPNIVYTSRPINNIFEIEKWTFTGKGKDENWIKEAITEKSERDNVRPFVVRNNTYNNPSVLWMYNYKYPGFRAYDSAIRINQKWKGYDATLSKESIETVSNAVYNWQVREYDSNKWNNMDARDWRAGTLYNGMLDWAETIESETYIKFLKKIFNQQAWQVGNRMYNADDISISQAYLDIYVKEKDKNMIIPTKARIDWIMANPPDENIDIAKGKSSRWWWCDALFMAPPVYARLYNITGDEAYLQYAHKEFQATYEHLYSHQYQLFYRDARYFEKKESNGEPMFWARGNGWVLVGIAEVLKNLPKGDKIYRPFYEQLLKEMSASIIKYQGKNGYWSTSLLDSSAYPAPETSGTGLITYALAYGINEGILDRTEYMPIVLKGWSALVSAVDTEGKVCWVQLVAQAPGAVEKHHTQVYGAGAFLMTASELYKMCQ